MSRARIALATALILLGIVGAVIVLKATEGGGDKASAAAEAPKAPAISLVHSRSRCLIDSGTGVVVFRVVLRNSGNQDQATRLHPSVGLRDGGEIAVTSYDTTASLLAAEERTYEIDVPYEPGNQRPNRCHVALGDGAQAAIAVRRAS